jgi:hypothetical protein
VPGATDTPVPPPTDTPVPPTETPAPQATDTPVPPPTDTPVATATNTPPPTATATPPAGCLTFGQKLSLAIGILFRFNSEEGDRRFKARYDLNHDNRIDGADLDIVLSMATCKTNHGRAFEVHELD